MTTNLPFTAILEATQDKESIEKGLERSGKNELGFKQQATNSPTKVGQY